MDPATPSSTTLPAGTPPAGTLPAGTPPAGTARPRPSATEQRIAAVVGTEPVIAWARAWVSHETRMHVFAARTLDFVVVTDRSLYLLSTGFFSRRPRRLVFAAPRESLVVGKRPRNRSRLTVTAAPQKTLVLELRSKPEPNELVDALLGAAREADTL